MTDVNGHPWPASLGPETDTQNASAVDMTREERVAVLAQVRALAESIRDRVRLVSHPSFCFVWS